MRLRTDDARPAGESNILTDERTLLPKHDKESLLHTVGPDGDVLLEVGRHDQPDETDDEANLHPGKLTILDPATGRSELVRSKEDSHDHTQTVFADMDDEYVAWVEEPETSIAPGDWKLYAENRSTGAIMKVSERKKVERLGKLPQARGSTIPTLNKGWVYWTEPAPNPKQGGPLVVNIYGRNLESSSPPQLVAKNADAPIARGNWLYYVEFDPERFTKPEYAVYRKSLSTGETTLIHKDKGRDTKSSTGRAASLAAHGGLVAWRVNDVVLVFDGTKQIAKIGGRPGQSLSRLDVGEKAIGFADGSDGPGTQYLLDLRSGCLHALGNGDGLGQVLIADENVVWFTPQNRKGLGPSKWHYAKIR